MNLTTAGNILSETALGELRPAVCERLESLAADMSPEQVAGLLDPLMRQVLEEGFKRARADEGTLWMVDAAGECLVPAFNNGPNAARFVGQFRQPLASGLICMVFASEQPFVENEVHKNTNQSRVLDTLLEVRTLALIAVPFHFLQACRGVISCVQLDSAARAPGSAGFTAADLESVQLAATVVGRLMEYRLVSSALNWS